MSDSNSVQEVSIPSIIEGIFRLIKKYFLILVITNAIILAGGIGWRLNKDLAYEGTTLVKSNFLEYHFIEGIIEPLNRHINEMHPEILANSLGIDVALASKLGNISTRSLIDEEYVEKRKFKNLEDLDEYELDVVFELSLSSSEPEKLPALKDAVINYMKNQDYIKQRKAFYEKERQEISKILEKDLATMDSIKKGIANLMVSKEDPQGVIIQDLGDFYYAATMVYDIYVESHYKNEFKEAFEQISSLEVYGKYVYPRWTFVLLITLGIMVGTSTLLIIGFESVSLFRKIEV